MKSNRSHDDNDAVNNFIKFLKIKSISSIGSKGAYWKCVRFLNALAENIGLHTSIIESASGKPILICSWFGSQLELPSILLNSHYDVVPVDENKWTMGNPFGASVLSNGDIVARGSQDMKSVCIQYLMAIQRLWLLRSGESFKRTIHLSFVPDEEIGGKDGMIALLKSTKFSQMNVGLTLDEGLASENKSFSVYYGQRTCWWVIVKATGPAGHGSRLIEDTAMEKLIRCINKFLSFRYQQLLQLKQHNKLGEVVTINLTAIKGGHSPDGGNTWAMNVIPVEVLAGFDIRIPPSFDLVQFDALLKEWTKEPGVNYSFQIRQPKHSVSSINSKLNPWWSVIKKAFKNMNLEIEPAVFPAGTDSSYIRILNIPAFGFSPMNNTPTLLHDHNERLNTTTFLKGIDIYEALIPILANNESNNNPHSRLSNLPAKF